MFEKRKNWQFGEWMWGSWGWARLKFWGIGDWESGVGAVNYQSLGGRDPSRDAYGLGQTKASDFSPYLRYAVVPLKYGSL